jgi:uncharacterized protein (TIGR02996 family)
MTAVDHRAALFAAILADPDDDALWLAYSDALEEAAGVPLPRAEFIRVQVELANLVDRPLDPATLGTGPALRRRERELLVRHWTAWTDGIQAGYCLNLYTGTPLIPPNRAVTFRRGFVSSVILAFADWLAHGDALLAAAPVVEVTLTDWPVAHVETASFLFWLPGRIRRFAPDDLRRPGDVPGWWYADAPDAGRVLPLRLLEKYWPRVKTWNLPA